MVVGRAVEDERCVVVGSVVLTEDVTRGSGVVGDGCTSTSALEITAQFGTELLESCALMLSTVSAFAVAVAWAGPFSC